MLERKGTKPRGHSMWRLVFLFGNLERHSIFLSPRTKRRGGVKTQTLASYPHAGYPSVRRYHSLSFLACCSAAKKSRIPKEETKGWRTHRNGEFSFAAR